MFEPRPPRVLFWPATVEGRVGNDKSVGFCIIVIIYIYNCYYIYICNRIYIHTCTYTYIYIIFIFLSCFQMPPSSILSPWDLRPHGLGLCTRTSGISTALQALGESNHARHSAEPVACNSM